ncbi:plasmid pRiA4b ORF-3 family protein [Paenarthrobacter sp. PH39-S1]|uniref:plasmid pRiA4b ORF-3 family protein n=1 Tax=Paenarthrobacter sp. PH39-S1 TaxID=3046204 RepID=UPI0024BADB81|nr:plasmid pRiA4b ORF-3 family protein [Paenarthrobacter sp. PH39-S1]MDJ0355445.1 plasmid pRiA4b ORF-3 family protein [Paenarthrobacter sp. PH39-S1]
MSRNSRNRHKAKDTAARKGSKGAAGSASTSMSTFRAGRAIDALTPAFVQWFDDGSAGAATAALDYLAEVKAVIGRYMEGMATAEVTVFEPIPLAIATTDVLVSTDEETDAMFIVDAVHAYVDFLTETGRWTGSAEQLAQVMDFLKTVEEDDDDQLGLIEIPDLGEDEALEVFAGLPLIQRTMALLRWIGDGRPVSGTGALRLKDLEAAAACVGVSVRGAVKGAQPDDAIPIVRSMQDVPLLPQIWAAMEAAELIEIKATKVMRFEDADGFLSGSTAQRLEEYSYYTTRFLEQTVLGMDPAFPDMSATLVGLEVSLLIAASTPEPPSVERVLALADRVPEEEKMITDILGRMTVGRLERLAELGLLTIDTHFRVPPALIGCVLDAFDDDVIDRLHLGEAVDDAKLPTAAPVLQLKIQLKNAKPPIWRRVLVPADMPLDQLHSVIQSVFGWLDCHLHNFQTGGFRGPSYAPVDPDGLSDSFGEPSLDESTVTVGELLGEVGSKMVYTYDFGDDWEHAIAVEKILTDDCGGQLPRCTGGRGAAPAEDSGGTWGWTKIVQAVNDPEHEEHEEYREWLALQSGETLDPKAFDVEEANGDLADIF